MTSFRELLQNKSFNHTLEGPSVSLAAKASGHELHLRLDAKDRITAAAYTGKFDPWLSSLCHLARNKSLAQGLALGLGDWDREFSADPLYWELKEEQVDRFVFPALELFRATLDVLRGREYLYREQSPLICRCFGVRESDVVSHLKETPDPTLETLSKQSKAGMGCRSCVPQLKRWLLLHDGGKRSHHFKEKPRAAWLLEIDYLLSCFPQSLEWKMELKSFRGSQVLITHQRAATQREEEEMGKELQKFLSAATDPDLGFFLTRKRTPEE